MSESPNPAPSPGGTDPSSDRFDRQTAAVPAQIGGETIEGEVLPPGEESKETGWPLWDLQLIGRLPFFFLSRRYGDVWHLDDEESQALAEAWKPLLDRYFPLENTEWGTAALVTLAIVGPRAMQTDWSKNQKQKKPGAQSTPPASTKTEASGESSATSAKENPASQPDWELLRDP